jgi:hypothetical protein
MNLRLFIACAALFCASAGAAQLAIVRAAVVPRFQQVEVQLSVKTGVSTKPADWTIEIDDANGHAIPGVTVSSVTVSLTAPDHVILQLPNTLSLAGWSQVFVTYQPAGLLTFRFLGKPADKPKAIVGADSKSNADVYLNGVYSPRIGSPAQYSYDVAIGYGLPYWSKDRPALGRLGFSITAASDHRKNLDPDSYYAGLFWQAYPVVVPHGILQGIVYQMDFGGEFAKKKLGSQTKTSNFLAPAPRFEFPMRLYPLPGHALTGVFATLRPIAGFDWGHNFQNAAQPDGSGLMARGLAGADFAITYKPKKPFLYSLSVSSSWRGRYLFEKEVDTTSVYSPAKQDFVYAFGLSSKPRNHISSKLDWKWTDFFGLTITHELGAVPPLFNYVDHSVTIGFTFSASFAKESVQRRQ